MDFEWGIGTLGPVGRGELHSKVDVFSADRGLDFVVEKRASGGPLHADHSVGTPRVSGRSGPCGQPGRGSRYEVSGTSDRLSRRRKSSRGRSLRRSRWFPRNADSAGAAHRWQWPALAAQRLAGRDIKPRIHDGSGSPSNRSGECAPSPSEAHAAGSGG